MLALAAACLLASAVAASANNLEVSSQNIRVVWEHLGFGASGSAEPTISCPVTLEGSFHYRTMAKVRSALIGNITRATVDHAGCEGGDAWAWNGTETVLGGGAAANTLPWHVTYEGFTGTLPRITGVKLLLTGTTFTLAVARRGELCLAVYGNETENIIGVASVDASGRITGLAGEEGVRLRRTQTITNFLNISCPTEGRFFRSGTVTVLGETASVTVRLI